MASVHGVFSLKVASVEYRASLFFHCMARAMQAEKSKALICMELIESRELRQAEKGCNLS
jgi:hypothetical protein